MKKNTNKDIKESEPYVPSESMKESMKEASDQAVENENADPEIKPSTTVNTKKEKEIGH